MPIVTGNNNSGIVSANPTIQPIEPITTVLIASTDYKDVALDTRSTPINSILRHVEGASWTVDWYSQVLDRDSQLSGQQATSSATHQQYTKISGLELKVTSALSQSQDETTKTMTYSGEALVYGFMIANEGDMFVADIGDGQTATFRVTSSVKRSIFKQAVYEIGYVIGTTDPTYLQDLFGKVVNTFVYRRDFLMHGQDPLVIESDAQLLEALGSVYSTLAEQHFPRYLSKEYMTFILPGQVHPVYDPFYTRFVLSMFATQDSHVIAQARNISVSEDPLMEQSSLWSALMYADRSYVETGFTKVKLVSTKSFSPDPRLNPIRYTGIKFCVYPLNPVSHLTNGAVQEVLPAALVTISSPENDTFIPLLPLAANAPMLPLSSPLVHPVLIDDYYVLSHCFYLQTAQQSQLEYQVSQYLTGAHLNLAQLTALAKAAPHWGRLEQFYYVPILLVLIRGAITRYQG